MGKSLLFTAILILGGGQVCAQTQDQSKYLISAKTGVVNFVQGDLYYTSGGRPNLIAGEEMRSGETAETGSASLAEILLTPGSYLRLDHDTQIVIVDVSFDNLTVKLQKGAAILEVPRSDDKGGVIARIVTPKAAFSVTRGGLYRFNVGASERTEVLVYKGKLFVEGAEIKEGKKVTIDGQRPVVASFDKNAQDDLDAWSMERARELVAANEKIKSDYVSEAYQNSYASNYDRYLYGPNYGWYGSWFYNPFLGCYTFLPGARGFHSPYGWRYRFFYPIPFSWIRHPGIVANPAGSSGHKSAKPSKTSSPTVNPTHDHKVSISVPRNHPAGGGHRSHGGGGRHHR